MVCRSIPTGRRPPSTTPSSQSLQEPRQRHEDARRGAAVARRGVRLLRGGLPLIDPVGAPSETRRRPGPHRDTLQEIRDVRCPLRPRSADKLPEEPLIPQRRGGGTAGYWLYLIPGLVLVTVIVVVPLVWNIYLSFTDWRGIRPPEFIGLENWIELFGDATFWTSFVNSIWMIVAMVIFPTLIGLVLAALLFDVIGRKYGGRLASFLRATYYLPQILPAAIAGIVIGWILRPQDGALNTILESIGLGFLARNWLGSPDTALASIMVVLVWIQIGYPVVVFMAALQRVDPELYEAAGSRRRQLVPAVPGDHRQHHPPRDLRRHPHLHDRGAEGLRPRVRTDSRRPR